jgi:hypothetical protein
MVIKIHIYTNFAGLNKKRKQTGMRKQNAISGHANGHQRANMQTAINMQRPPTFKRPLSHKW